MSESVTAERLMAAGIPWEPATLIIEAIDEGGASPAIPNLTSTGNSQGTALPLPGLFCIFTSVPGGSGTIIPPTALVGDVFEVWNADPANTLNVFPMVGAQIQNFGATIAAQIAAGGSGRFAIASTTQIYAR